MRRDNGQASFADALVVGGGDRRLEAIEAALDGAALETLLEPIEGLGPSELISAKSQASRFVQ